MKALFTYNKNLFFKRKTSFLIFLFLSFILIVPGIPYVASGQTARQIPAPFIFTAAICITMIVANIMLFGSNFMELKKTSLLKRLGITRLTKFELIMGYAL